MRVVVLGGRGLVGTRLTKLLQDAGVEITVASRSGEPAVDIRTGEGLDRTLEGSDVVVHLASDARSPQETDVAGTARILEAIDRQHLVYLSIVGVDRHPFPYYRAKRQAELLIEGSGVDYTILRATQFYPFVEFLLAAMCRRWAALVPARFVAQPIDVDEAASELARAINEQPIGLQPDLGGPEVLTVDELARSFMEARGREAPLIRVPFPGKAAQAFRAGIHTNPERAVGVKTWSEYLQERFGDALTDPE